MAKTSQITLDNVSWTPIVTKTAARYVNIIENGGSPLHDYNVRRPTAADSSNYKYIGQTTQFTNFPFGDYLYQQTIAFVQLVSGTATFDQWEE